MLRSVSEDGLLCGTLFAPFTVVKGGYVNMGRVYPVDRVYVQYHLCGEVAESPGKHYKYRWLCWPPAMGAMTVT